MFKRREPSFNGMPDMNPYQQGFYQDNQMQRIFYQKNRKLFRSKK